MNKWREMNAVWTVLTALCLVLLAPLEASAQVTVGSSGSLVGAALQTAGFYYHSYILDVFTPTLQGSMGILVYMIGAVAALGGFVLMGDSKMAKWFLISPALFFSIILPRTETMGTAWVFGAEDRATEKAQNQGMTSVREDRGNTVNTYTPSVSSVFAWYDNLVSDTVRGIVSAINGNDRLKADVTFLARTELISQLKSELTIEPGFREFIQVSMLGHCRRAMEAGKAWRIVEPPQVDPGTGEDTTWPASWSASPPTDDCVLCQNSVCPPAQVEDLETRHCVLKKRYRDALVQRVTPTERGYQYMAKLRYHYPLQFNAMVNDPGFWDSISQAVKAINEAAAMAGGEPPADYEEQLALRLKEVKDPANGTATLSCGQVWNITYIGLHMYSMQIVDRNLKKMEERGKELTPADRDQMKREVLEGWMKIHGVEPDGGDWGTLNVDLPVNLYRVIAQTVFRNEVNSPTTSSFIAEFTERTSDFSSIEIPGENDAAFIERTRLSTGEWEERSKVMHTAGSLPYYQGLALYFLAVGFPFFSLLVLIPGKYGGFILWFGLWMWIKSWDIGFAIVMLLDDALFAMMAARAYHNPAPTGLSNPVVAEGSMNSLQLEMSTAIHVMNEADPTFSLTTYYGIIAIAIQSIPIASSYLIMGSLRGGGGMIASGMKNYASYFGGAANLTAGQSITNSTRAGVLSGQMGAAKAALANAKAGRSPYAGTNMKRAPDRGVTGGSYRGGSGSRSGRFMNMNLDQMQKWAERAGLAGGFMKGYNNGGAINELMNAADSVSRWGARRQAAGAQRRSNQRFDARNQQRRANGQREMPNSRRPRVSTPRSGLAHQRAMTEMVPDGKGGRVKQLTRAGRRVGRGKGIAMVTAALEDPLLAISDGLGDIRSAEVATTIRWARYDYMNSAHAQRLSAMSRIAGGLEIPMTENGAYDEEFKKQITILKAQAGLVNGVLSAADKTIGAWQDMKNFQNNTMGDLSPNGVLDEAGDFVDGKANNGFNQAILDRLK